MTACDTCLRRAWLVGRLSGHLDVVRNRQAHIREVLALSDADLVAALGGSEQRTITQEHAAFVADSLRAEVEGAGQHAICSHDSGYPPALRELPDQPAVLFVAGGERAAGDLMALTGDPAAHPAVALVGARRASTDAKRMAETLGRDLSIAGVPVVSGMAMGVDAWAHRGALVGTGGTIAVLGGGADVVYPRHETGLYDQLVRDGVVVSELPPRTAVRKWTFPARNRLIAALSAMTVVVEAAERSGSLITATLAESLGRELGAVPGRPTVVGTRGTNGLLRQGCAVIRDAQDVLDQLFGAGARTAGQPPRDLTRLEPGLRGILRAVGEGRDTVGELCTDPRLVAVVTSQLGELEYRGYLRRTADGRYEPVP